MELPTNWKLPKKWAETALAVRKDWTMDHVKACAKGFHSWNTSKHNTRNNLDEWELAWKAWVLRQRTEYLRVKVKKENNWWNSASGIEAKGKELGLIFNKDYSFAYYKEAVIKRAGINHEH